MGAWGRIGHPALPVCGQCACPVASPWHSCLCQSSDRAGWTAFYRRQAARKLRGRSFHVYLPWKMHAAIWHPLAMSTVRLLEAMNTLRTAGRHCSSMFSCSAWGLLVVVLTAPLLLIKEVATAGRSTPCLTAYHTCSLHWTTLEHGDMFSVDHAGIPPVFPALLPFLVVLSTVFKFLVRPRSIHCWWSNQDCRYNTLWRLICCTGLIPK